MTKAKKNESIKKEYEVVPIDDVLDLKEKLDRYSKSKNPFISEIEDLKHRMSKLTEHMETINTIFDTAKEELELEKKQQDFIDNSFSPLLSKVTTIEDQSVIIATALLNIVDMFKENNQMVLDELNEIKLKVAELKQSQNQTSALNQIQYPQTIQPQDFSEMQLPTIRSFSPNTDERINQNNIIRNQDNQNRMIQQTNQMQRPYNDVQFMQNVQNPFPSQQQTFQQQPQIKSNSFMPAQKQTLNKQSNLEQNQNQQIPQKKPLFSDLFK